MSLQPCYLAYTSPSAWLTPLGPRPLHIFLTQSSPSGVSSTYRISPSRPHTQTHRHPHTHTDTHVPPVAGGYLMGPFPSLFLTLSLPRSYHCPGHWGPIGQAEESGVIGSPRKRDPFFCRLAPPGPTSRDSTNQGSNEVLQMWVGMVLGVQKPFRACGDDSIRPDSLSKNTRESLQRRTNQV